MSYDFTATALDEVQHKQIHANVRNNMLQAVILEIRV